MAGFMGPSPLFILISCILTLVLYQCDAQEMSRDGDCHYKGAVYEHFSLSSLKPSVTKSEAQKVMNVNLDTYEANIKNASLKGSRIIVFPEYGITGFFIRGTRDSILPFLEIVPNATTPVTNPCTQAEFSDRPVQRRLSCLAKQYSIIVVVDMSTMQPCKQVTDPHCPKDGRYQFNTALAFGTDGSLLAIYHKSNLYTEESHLFDSGCRTSNIDTGIFTTDFGTFSLFICFDILFDYPSKYFKQYHVDSVAFPTAWMNELPLLSAIEYQQAWSLGMNMNLLGSNQHLPLEHMTGSGLFSASDGAVSYHYDMVTYSGRLLVADLPCFPEKWLQKFKHVKDGIDNVNDVLGHDSNSILNYKSGNVTGPSYKQSIFALKLESNRSVDLNAIEYKKAKIVSMTNKSADFVKDGDVFTALVNDDPYNLQLLVNPQGSVSVSDGDLACTLNYSISDKWHEGDWYAFGAFSGLHTKNGQYFVQACVLLRCAATQKSKCGAETNEAHTVFKEFSLKMDAYSKDTFLAPEILSAGVTLPKKGLSWDTSEDINKLWVPEGGLKDALLMAGIYGRLYDKD